MIYENIVQTIGKTPIVRINSVREEGMAEIYAKLEFFNPGGSVKDRIAASMILGMQKEGTLKKGDIIVEGPPKQVMDHPKTERARQFFDADK